MPDNVDVAGFLQTLDSRPRLIPTWPLSEHMVLVGLVGVSKHDPAVAGKAFVMTRKSEVDSLIEIHTPISVRAVLFFTVLRSRVLPYCQLEQKDWE